MPSDVSRPAAAAVLVAAAVVGFGGGAMLATGALDAAPGAGASPPSTTSPAPTGTAATALSLTAEPTTVAAGKTIRLTGRLRPARAGVTLQVERSLDGGDWEDFPVTATTKEGGAVDITVESSRVGENRFRLTGDVDGDEVVSEVVAVAIS